MKASYTLVEPQGELRIYVQDLVEHGCRMQWICAGAGDKPGLLPFTVISHDVSSTFAISQEDAQKAGHRQIAIPVRTLDKIVSSSDLPIPEMVKIDTEGFDQGLQGCIQPNWRDRNFLNGGQHSRALGKRSRGGNRTNVGERLQIIRHYGPEPQPEVRSAMAYGVGVSQGCEPPAGFSHFI